VSWAINRGLGQRDLIVVSSLPPNADTDHAAEEATEEPGSHEIACIYQAPGYNAGLALFGCGLLVAELYAVIMASVQHPPNWVTIGLGIPLLLLTQWLLAQVTSRLLRGGPVIVVDHDGLRLGARARMAQWTEVEALVIRRALGYVVVSIVPKDLSRPRVAKVRLPISAKRFTGVVHHYCDVPVIDDPKRH
jgi:hypothetical protein